MHILQKSFHHSVHSVEDKTCDNGKNVNSKRFFYIQESQACLFSFVNSSSPSYKTWFSLASQSDPNEGFPECQPHSYKENKNT